MGIPGKEMKHTQIQGKERKQLVWALLVGYHGWEDWVPGREVCQEVQLKVKKH